MKINKISVGNGAEAGYTLRDAVNPLLPYDGFNACHYTNDSPCHVKHCREELCATLNVADGHLIIPRQTHSSNVMVIDSPLTESELPEGVDALVTTKRGVTLCVNTADCVPVVLNDPESGVVGICHAGWRGVVNGVVENTVEAMRTIGADTTQMHAAMGPCICCECFEVGTEVAEKFAHIPGTVMESTTWSKPHVDLAAAIAHILSSKLNLDPGNITMPPECTMHSWQSLFSARRMGINSGRVLTYIRLAK